MSTKETIFLSEKNLIHIYNDVSDDKVWIEIELEGFHCQICLTDFFDKNGYTIKETEKYNDE